MKTLTTTFVFLFFGLSAWGACMRKEVSFPMTDPIDGTPWVVRAHAYHPDTRAQGKFPVIFVLPPLPGRTELDRILAVNFCKNGIGAYILNVVKDYPLKVQIENLNLENERLIRAQAGVSHVMDKLQQDQNVSGTFGIMGSSQGAIFAAYAAGIDSRLKSSVMVVGGGNMPGILSYGQELEINALRNGRMKYFKIPTQKDYEIFLQKYITIDPLNVAANISPHSTYLFLANRDTTVPTRYQQQLKRSIAYPLVWVMNGEHSEGVIKAALIHKHKITRFFLNRLF